MGRYRSRSRSYSPVRRKRYDDPRHHRRSPGPTGLLVRNISLSARVEDLRVPFERFGPVKDVYIPKNYYTGEARGFGFVKFRFADDAAEAKKRLNNSLIGGREIRIVFAEENRKTPQEMRRLSRVSSGRESYGRRSRSRSPRRRYRSYSRSLSPPRRASRFFKVNQRFKEFWPNKDKRERDHKVKDPLLAFIFKPLQMSLSSSIIYGCMHRFLMTLRVTV
ncbi:hypothetical protein AgCh_018406 [Apium graveolens]